ncbi:MAG: tetratricopeptide repeat protein [Leptospiraceae bacterium]|nr:tetratricopeptide repeat protein [Leptospiraceae bacterium]MDW8307685.1 tetratricopeptide repeat protein [Leptospiraceae bacterium]
MATLILLSLVFTAVGAEGLKSDLALAEEYYFARKFATAAQYLERQLAKDPHNSRAAALMGDILLFNSRYEEAIRYYERALEFSDEPAVEHYRLGQALLALKRGQEAKGHFQKAYEIDPSLHRCLFQIGYISLLYERNKENTIFYWRRFLAQDPQDPQADKIEEAIRVLEDPNFELPQEATLASTLDFLRYGSTYSEPQQVLPKDKEAPYLEEKEVFEKKDLLPEDE